MWHFLSVLSDYIQKTGPSPTGFWRAAAEARFFKPMEDLKWGTPARATMHLWPNLRAATCLRKADNSSSQMATTTRTPSGLVSPAAGRPTLLDAKYHLLDCGGLLVQLTAQQAISSLQCWFCINVWPNVDSHVRVAPVVWMQCYPFTWYIKCTAVMIVTSSYGTKDCCLFLLQSLM